MAACWNCGAQVFFGEPSCPACKAEQPTAPTGSGPAAGSATGPSTAPPPEGLRLIVEKGLDDRDVRRGDDERLGDDRFTTNRHVTFGDSVDDMAEALSPQRDRQGRVIWDWKTALVGGIVLAIVVGVAIFVVTASFSGTGRVR